MILNWEKLILNWEENHYISEGKMPNIDRISAQIRTGFKTYFYSLKMCNDLNKAIQNVIVKHYSPELSWNVKW